MIHEGIVSLIQGPGREVPGPWISIQFNLFNDSPNMLAYNHVT